MLNISDRLKAAREARYPSARQAAEAMGVNYQTYIAHENGNRGLKRDALVRYSRFFRVSLNWLLTGAGEMKPASPDIVYTTEISVQGEVQAGVWKEYDEGADDKYKGIAVPSHPSIQPDGQFALLVRGDSMNKLVQDGQYVQCISMEHYAGGIRDKQIVVVKRSQDQLHETTLKQVRISADKPIQLWPLSTNPRFQEPIEYDNGNGSGIEIVAVVLGAFTDFSPQD